MFRPGVVVLLIAIILACITLAGCQPEESSAPFSIAWTYDISGELHPCGCSAKQLGGIGRRSTQLAILRQKQPLIAIEGGHLFENHNRFELFKGTIIMKALNSMGYDGMMIGASEARQGISGIQELAQIAEFPLFSANLVSEGHSWPQSFIVIEAGGTRVGFTGVTQPEMITYPLPESMEFAPPEPALDAALTQLDTKADFVVACLEGDTEWIAAMAAKYDERVNLFLSGDRSVDAHALAVIEAAQALDQQLPKFELPNLEFSHSPPQLNNWGLGRYLGVIQVRSRQGKYRIDGANIALDDKTPEDQAIKDILSKDYLPQLRDYFAEYTTEVMQAYLPSDRCEGCHAEAVAILAATAHVHSLETLKAAGRAYDPDCIKCHVVYDEETQKLHALNCLSCHTNIDYRHEWQALEGMISRPAEPVTEFSLAACVKCHDEENSLPFATHWPQYCNLIYHGGDLSCAEEAALQLGIDINSPPPDMTMNSNGPVDNVETNPVAGPG